MARLKTAMVKSEMTPCIYPQWQKACYSHHFTLPSPHAAVTVKSAIDARAPLLSLRNQRDVFRQTYSEQAMIYRAKVQERLICDAEMALASQTIHTYLRWYSHWRHSGVRVNDLLDMTWVWRERARFGSTVS